jgi:hypothetical protein
MLNPVLEVVVVSLRPVLRVNVTPFLERGTHGLSRSRLLLDAFGSALAMDASSSSDKRPSIALAQLEHLANRLTPPPS